MLHDWFLNQQIPITWDQFVALPRHPAYRYEYRQASLDLTGNPRFVHCLAPLDRFHLPATPYPASPAAPPEPLQPDDWSALPALFAAAFSRTPPLAHRSTDDQLHAARSLMEATRTGGYGPLIDAASFVCRDESSGELLGAILPTLIPAGSLQDFTQAAWHEPAPADAGTQRWGQPHLTWIFVSPSHLRRGLGKQLVRHAAASLQALGYDTLASTVMIGDHASLLWHWKQGFSLISRDPDASAD